MSRSLSVSANYIGKFHAAVLDASTPASKKLTLYPMMDGVYVVSVEWKSFRVFINDLFVRLAHLFVVSDVRHRFVPRGAFAFGPFIHGSDVSCDVCDVLAGNVQYSHSILLGMPVIQAFEGERDAPPFGIFVHESARAFGPESSPPVSAIWWEWFREHHQLAQQLKKALYDYFLWCRCRCGAIGYEEKNIDRHAALSEQYLCDVSKTIDENEDANRPSVDGCAST